MSESAAAMPVAPALDAYELAQPVELFPLPGATGINNPVLGVRTGAGEFVWKGYATHADAYTILYEHRLLGWLTDQRLPFAVPAPVPTRHGETLCSAPGSWQALFARLPGSRPDHHDPAQVEAVGAALGQLHAALAAYPLGPRPGMSPYGALHAIHPRIPDPYALTPARLGLPDTLPYVALLGWWREELARLRAFVDGPYRALPRQVIHGDCTFGNFLARAGRVTAILDFDVAGPDARAVDIASGLRFSMRVHENREPLTMARAFCCGYARHVALMPDEVAALPWLIRLRVATAAVWWLGRALAAGDARPQLERLEEMRASARWLTEHEHQLLDLARETCLAKGDAPDG